MATATRDAEGFVLDIQNIPEDQDFVIYGTVHAHPQHADALEAVYAETTRLAESEPGTVYYCICRDREDRNLFHMFERYKGRAGFEAHNAQPIIQRLVNEWKYFRGVKASFPPAGLRGVVSLEDGGEAK